MTNLYQGPLPRPTHKLDQTLSMHGNFPEVWGSDAVFPRPRIPREEVLAGLNRSRVEMMKVDIVTGNSSASNRQLREAPESSNQQQMCFWSTIPLNTQKDSEMRSYVACMAVSRVSGTIICFLYFRDLTERIRTERHPREANSFLENIIESIVEGIIVLDMKGADVMEGKGRLTVRSRCDEDVECAVVEFEDTGSAIAQEPSAGCSCPQPMPWKRRTAGDARVSSGPEPYSSS